MYFTDQRDLKGACKMKNRIFGKYYLFTIIGVLTASFYPLYMGVKVIFDMLRDGTVMKENYPKYIIPYTPVCIALLLGVLLMPLCFKLCKRAPLLAGSGVSAAVFFLTELLFERKVVITSAVTEVKLEDWQMFMCILPPDGWGEEVTTYRSEMALDILMGEYDPAFKLHFYVISLLIIFAVLGCIYGFGKAIVSGEKGMIKSLAIQSVATVFFIGMCILACFTAFWRDGSLEVSPLSAVLMTVFFILFGMVGGLYFGSFFLYKRKLLSIVAPAVLASALTCLMYAGEMILLKGKLYIFGSSLLFTPLPVIVLSVFDVIVVLASGLATALVCRWLRKA